MENIHQVVLSRVALNGQGWTFTPDAFHDLATPNVIGVVLGRLAKAGKIKRVARGLYSYPKQHKKFGALFPAIDEVAQAIAQRDQIRILPSGAYAANLLGLSEQVPAKVVYLTDGKSRTIKLGEASIEFKKTAPRYVALAGTESGLVIQALRHIGKEYIESKTIRTLRAHLSKKTKKELLSHLTLAPAWMRPVLKEIAEYEKKAKT
jgi:hypothetical protein